MRLLGFHHFPMLAWLVLFFAMAGSIQAGMPPRPAGGDFLQDYAGVIPADIQQTIREHQAAAFRASKVPLVIVTVSDLQQYDLRTSEIEAYARAWFNAWGVGSAQKNDGILILLAVKERRARIELGAAWEHRWDAYTQKVMDGRMVPRFKTGDYAGGLLAGLEALERMAARGAGSEPPAESGWEKFAGSALGYYAIHDNPLVRSIGPRITGLLLILGGVLAVTGCFVPAHRKLLWKIGGGLLGLVLLFWIAVVVLVLISGLIQRIFDRDDSADSSSSSDGYDGGSSGGGGASGSW